MPGGVGFRGAESSLVVIDGPDSAPPGTQWNSQYNYLDVRSPQLTLDGVYVKGGIDFYGAGTLTIRNSIVEGGYGSWMIIMLRAGAGPIDLSDSTLRWRSGSTPAAGSGAGAIQVSGDHNNSSVVRNDISGNPDGIQVAGNGWLIQQNWIHGLAMIGSYPNNTHNDGVQVYSGSGHRIVSNRFETGATAPYSNSPIFLQGSGIGAVLIQGNYLDGGGYSLYPQNGTITVVDNVFGPNHLYGPIRVEAGVAVAAWSGNQASDGSVITQP